MLMKKTKNNFSYLSPLFFKRNIHVINKNTSFSMRGTYMNAGTTKMHRLAQSGRSMVEMLATLAIIGILSVGGITGYSYGVDKYRANTTINDINLRAVDLISQITNGTNPNLSEWPSTSTVGYPISLSTEYAPSQYFIKVEQIPYSVCKIIVDTFPDNEVEIWIDNKEEECKEINTMEFGYDGFVKKGCSTSAECRGNTPVCNPNTGTCEPYPDDDACGGCPSEKPYCDSATGVCGDCKYDSDCTHLGDNYLCLHHSSGATHLSTYQSGYNTCKSIKILYSFEAGGVNWTKIHVNGGSPVYYDAQKACAHLNMRLPTLKELISNYQGPLGKGFELTPLGTALAEAYDGRLATGTPSPSYGKILFIAGIDTGWVSHDGPDLGHDTLCRDK